MLKPLENWICDVCGGIIESAGIAIVAWNVDGQNLRYRFRIVHQVKCDLHDDDGWLHVDSLLGPNGASAILSLLAEGPIVGTGVVEVRNVDEFVDLFRRLHLPYYEEARTKFHLDSARELLDDPTRFSALAMKHIVSLEFP